MGGKGGLCITIRMERSGKLGTDKSEDEAEEHDFSSKQSLFKRTASNQIGDAQSSDPDNHHNFHHCVSKKGTP